VFSSVPGIPAYSGSLQQQAFLCLTLYLVYVQVVGWHVFCKCGIGSTDALAKVQCNTIILIIHFNSGVVIEHFYFLSHIAVWDAIVQMIFCYL
jgi:hypothetical protein